MGLEMGFRLWIGRIVVNTEQKWGSGDRGIGEVGSDWENQIFFSILEGFWSDVLDVLGVFIDQFFSNHFYFKVKILAKQ